MAQDEFVVPVPRQVTLPVAGSSSRFPVRRIYCIGRNYVKHVREMGGDEERDPPIFFQKPTDSIVQDGSTIPYPLATEDLHHEVELAVAIGKVGSDVSDREALGHVFGYAVAIDLTRRDLQAALISGGSPWEISKSFDGSCPCGRIHPATSVGHIEAGPIRLAVGGETRQESDISLMIWKVPEIISRLSRYFELVPGDIVLTGTPHGIGPVTVGNDILCSIDKLGTLSVRIDERARAQ